MKEKFKKYWWVIIIILVIGVVFYWFQWRPSEIRKECFNSALKSPILKTLMSESEYRAELDFVYKNCLKMHGF